MKVAHCIESKRMFEYTDDLNAKMAQAKVLDAMVEQKTRQRRRPSTTKAIRWCKVRVDEKVFFAHGAAVRVCF